MTLRSHLKKDLELILGDRWGLAIALALPALIILAYSQLNITFATPPGRSPDAFILVVSTAVPVLLVASTALVQERRLGTFGRLARSPANILFVVASKTIASAAVIAMEVFVIMVSAVLFLAAKASGVAEHTAALAFVLLMTGIAAQALGLLVSSVARTEAQAIQLTALLFLLMFTLSGFLQPLDQIGAIGEVARYSPLALGFEGASKAIEGTPSAATAALLGAVAVGLVLASTLAAAIRR